MEIIAPRCETGVNSPSIGGHTTYIEPQSPDAITRSETCNPEPLTYGSIPRIDPPTTNGAAPRMPRAPRVETPRAIITCETQPVTSTAVAPNTQGRIDIQPASFWVKPSPLTMNGVNQVKPSESAQYAPKVAAQQPMKVREVRSCKYGTRTSALDTAAVGTNGPSLPSIIQAATHIKPTVPSTPNA